MIATGGTIASKNVGGGLQPVISSSDLLNHVPEIASKCNVKTIQPFNLDSTNLSPRHWLEIVDLIETNYNDFDGFVITHGTDTMAYTAAALSYLIQNSPKPVVLTGSQKSVYLRDTDARNNLSDAFSYCTDEGACGVHIVFDGNVILGTRAKKTRTKSYNAFSSIDYPVIAVMRDGAPLYYIHEQKGEKPLFSHALNERVFVLKLIPGLSPDIFDWLEQKCDGLVVESFGSGGLPDYGDGAFFTRLKSFLEKGKSVVFTTQVEREGSALDKYAVGKRIFECGKTLEARSMTLEATVTKLMWALTSSDVNARFTTPIANDIL